MSTAAETYAERWAEEIDRVYSHESTDEVLDAVMSETACESEEHMLARVLGKAAQCIRNGVPATFTGPELDLVRHLMPAHEVDQSGAIRWALEKYGPAE